MNDRTKLKLNAYTEMPNDEDDNLSTSDLEVSRKAYQIIAHEWQILIKKVFMSFTSNGLPM